MQSLLLQEALFHLTIEYLKSQTRRSHNLGKINHDPNSFRLLTEAEKQEHIAGSSKNSKDKYLASCYFFFKHESGIVIPVRPKYSPGEIVFLAESCWLENGNFHSYYIDNKNLGTPLKKRSKLLMKSEWARHWAQIMSVRCERLFDITDEDCMKEGVQQFVSEGKQCYGMPEWDVIAPEAKQAYFGMFSYVNKDKQEHITSYNPFVFVYDYQYKNSLLNVNNRRATKLEEAGMLANALR